MLILSPSEIEQRFAADPGRATFPLFCSALIAHEAPHTSSFPILTSKAGPDGGIDGEWDLTQAAPFDPVSIARNGWNVYQFKTVDPTACGAKQAFTDLCGRVRGAVEDVIARSDQKRIPALYVLFTNLQLGPETQSTTRAKSKLNTNRARLRANLLQGAPDVVEVQIIDAAQIVGLVERHPALRLSWFSPQVGTTWEEMQREEHEILPAAPGLVGRQEELADLDRWLDDKETRVIAISGPNSVGKTRLCIEATRRFAPITLFVKDAAAVRQGGLTALACPNRPVIVVAEDPHLNWSNH